MTKTIPNTERYEEIEAILSLYGLNSELYNIIRSKTPIAEDDYDNRKFNLYREYIQYYLVWSTLPSSEKCEYAEYIIQNNLSNLPINNVLNYYYNICN